MKVSPFRTISGRIVLGFTVLIVTFGGVTAFTVLRMRQLGNDLRFARGAYLEASLNAAQLYTWQDGIVDSLDSNEDKILRGEMRPTLTNNRERRRAVLKRSQDMLSKLDENRPRVAELRGKIDEISAAYDEMDPLYDQLYTSTPEGRKIAFAEIKRREGKQRSIVSSWFNQLKGSTIRITQRLENTEERARLGALVLGGLAALVGLLTAVWAILTLRPLKRLRDGVRKVAAGDYRERVTVPGASEVADVAREFNAMAAALAQRELELIRSERLAAVGKMAAVITHEVRNPLSSIGLNTELLEETVRSLPPDKADEAVALCQAISKEVDRLTAITEEYLRFARMPRPKLEREQVNSIVTGLMEFQKEELAQRGVTLHADLAEGLPTVAADEAQLRQAFLNLIRNAADAMGHGGDLSIATSAADGTVEVRVADTGPGIAADVLPRIFEPFFSTKEGGTGLGLALTHQIIVEHGGKIDVQSQVGKGTAFVVRLPAAT